MPRGRKVSPEQIVVMLRQIEVQLEGKSLAASIHRGATRPAQRAQFGGW